MKDKLVKICALSGFLTAGFIQGCSYNQQTSQNTSAVSDIANPADAYCLQKGGKVQPKQNAKRSYSVCTFRDGLQIDTWDLYRENHKT